MCEQGIDLIARIGLQHSVHTSSVACCTMLEELKDSYNKVIVFRDV